MRQIRVLITDDAVVIRRLLTDVLSSDPQLAVVGAAPNGRFALAKIPQVNPDLVILDVEMPEMDGLETLAAIRKSYPLLPVIMFSTLTQRGASVTVEALTMGANDYVSKPANVGSVTMAIERIRQELIPKIKAFCGKAAGIEPPLTLPFRRSSRPAPARPKAFSPVGIVAIGVSTGGPNALAEIFPKFPDKFPVPIVVVQHMPPLFTRLLAERLDATSRLRVREGRAGEVLEPGCVWIAPGDYHMTVERQGQVVRLQTNQDPPENNCRPSVDPLFRSVVKCYGQQSLGIILTGMGQDGLLGAEQISQAGGRIMAQDEASSVVWGMPGAVAGAGLADKILPKERMAEEITGLVLTGRPALIAS